MKRSLPLRLRLGDGRVLGQQGRVRARSEGQQVPWKASVTRQRIRLAVENTDELLDPVLAAEEEVEDDARGDHDREIDPETGDGADERETTFIPTKLVTSVGTAMIAAQPVSFFMVWFIRTSASAKAGVEHRRQGLAQCVGGVRDAVVLLGEQRPAPAGRVAAGWPCP